MPSVRSTTAGIAAGLVVAGAAVTPPAPARAMPTVAVPAVQLSAVMAALPQPAAALPTPPDPFVTPGGTSPGDRIINGYNAIQPWVQYGVNLSAWAVGWLPWPIGLIGPQANILYSGWEPIGQALAYSAAYLLDGQFDLIGPTLVNGFTTGATNLVRGETQWVLSFFPPLPPISFPVLPVAATTLAGAAAPGSAATARTAAAGPATGAPAAEDPTPAAEDASPAPRAPRTAGRGARSQRSVPAATSATPAPAAAEANESVETPAVKTPAVKTPAVRTPKAARGAGKAEVGAARSTGMARAGR